MKNRHYNIFFTSEKDGTGKSFRFSKVSLLLGLFLFSATFFFAYIGLNRALGADPLTFELDQLRKYKYITSNLLIESGLQESVVDSEDLEKIIIDYIIANNMIYPSTPPVEGYVTRGLLEVDREIVHAGINVASKARDQIKAPLDGVIIVADIDDEFGGTIIIHHQNNFFTVYKHLDIVSVQPRDLISKNQIIGTIKNSDSEEGSYLHFEIWKDNQVLDPRDLIDDYKDKDVSIR